MRFVIIGNLFVGNGIEKLVGQLCGNDLERGFGRLIKPRLIRNLGPGNILVLFKVGMRFFFGGVRNLRKIIFDRKNSGIGFQRTVKTGSSFGLFPRNRRKRTVTVGHHSECGNRIAAPSAVGPPNHPIVDELIFQEDHQSVLPKAGCGKPLPELSFIKLAAKELGKVIANIVFCWGQSRLPPRLDNEPSVDQAFRGIATERFGKLPHQNHQLIENHGNPLFRLFGRILEGEN